MHLGIAMDSLHLELLLDNPPKENGNQLLISELGTAIVAQALHEMLYSARIVLTNGAVERDELFFPHKRIFLRICPFVILVNFSIFLASTLDSHYKEICTRPRKRERIQTIADKAGDNSAIVLLASRAATVPIPRSLAAG